MASKLYGVNATIIIFVFVCLFACLFVCLLACLFVCLLACLFVCLFFLFVCFDILPSFATLLTFGRIW